MAILAVILYGMCLWSYTVAVFTDAGSPIEVVSPPPLSFPNRLQTFPPSSIRKRLAKLLRVVGQRLQLSSAIPIHPLNPPSQKRRPRPVLPKMQLYETGPHPPLQHLSSLHIKNGPSLSLVGELHWLPELQAVRLIFDLFKHFLSRVLCSKCA